MTYQTNSEPHHMTHPQHILLVEDDPAIATSLKITFKREGWQLTWLDNASSVLPTLQHLNTLAHLNGNNDASIAQSHQNHHHSESTSPLTAIILDVGLPDGDGLTLCQHIRHASDIGTQADLPILFLTARSDEIDRIVGLEMGADDYCAKPFSPRELVARLKAIWRRQQLSSHAKNNLTLSEHSANTDSSADNNFVKNNSAINQNNHEPQLFNTAYGDWEYRPLDYSLHWQGVKLELSNTERKLLLALLSAPKQVFSREQLLTAISDYPDHRLARTVDSHIKSIRKQLNFAYQQANQAGTHSTNNMNDTIEVIHTHRGLGYGLTPA